MEGNTSFNLSWVPGERDRNHGFHILYLRKSGEFTFLHDDSEREVEEENTDREMEREEDVPINY